MTTTVELSKQDVAVLTLVGDGLTEAGAARRLEMSPRTLRRRLAGICTNLKVGTPIEAVVWAVKRGLI